MKKYRQKLMKHYICSVARVTACVSFLVLAIIGVSSLVRAMSLKDIAHEEGIPASWEVASLGNPETITVPITYWDQRQDDCGDKNRQFEWVMCHLYTNGALQGVVKDYLGTDGLPIPFYTSAEAAWAANKDVYTMNITGHEPVVSTDNFFRWFHETEVSKEYKREITFERKGKNTYVYGSRGLFPLNDVDFSANDEATKKGENFHFTSHLRIPVKITADGTEKFEFLGDDDVWVFLNGKLVLDIGGLHEAVSGSFTINQDGTLTTSVDSIANVAGRTLDAEAVPTVEDLTSRTWTDNYRDATNNLGTHPGYGTKEQIETLDIGLQAGDVVNLDFFYAERSTDESNTMITISNMHWPISADSDLQGEIVGKVGDTDSNLVQYNASITNRDPSNVLDLERLATYLSDTSKTSDDQKVTNSGFIPLSIKTLYYTTTPDNAKSWQAVKISAPLNTMDGFKFTTPIRMAPSGQDGDTLYFRFFAETSDNPTGTISALTSFYTELHDASDTEHRGVSGVTYDYTKLNYTGHQEEAATERTVTVDYVYDDENHTIAHDPTTRTVKSGQDFSIDSPEIDGYTPDQTVISGTMHEQDLTYTVIYSKTPDEDPIDPTPVVPKPQHTVTINYVDEQGNILADSYIETYDEGDSYQVTSPTVKGYTTDEPVVSDTVPNENVEHTVVYTKIENPPVSPGPVTPTEPIEPDDPVIPGDPVEPEVPAENLPNLPIIPSDMVDDDLIYLAPLGEVAFVPNTGIIDEFVAPIFEQYFASAILSQGFVLAALIIFAGSFATYFSLRKYLDLDLATRSANNRKPRPMPKSASSMKRTLAKSARSAAKAEAKSARTAKATAKTAKTAAKSTTKATKVAAKATTKSAKSTVGSAAKSTAKAKTATKTKK